MSMSMKEWAQGYYGAKNFKQCMTIFRDSIAHRERIKLILTVVDPALRTPLEAQCRLEGLL